MAYAVPNQIAPPFLPSFLRPSLGSLDLESLKPYARVDDRKFFSTYCYINFSAFAFTVWQ